MKLKIFTLILLFCFSSFSSFAVIDSPERVQTERIQNFQKENFSKKKNIKKRKFRLRDLFQWKKKIKKARKENKKNFSPIALASLILAVGGIGLVLLGTILGLPFLSYAFIGAEVAAFIAGILGLRDIKANPEKLKGKGMAWAGIIISGLIGVLIVVVFIALIIAFSNWI